MFNPLVSVIIPVYNVEQYLSQCLDSVLHQTYKNIEIITINDGSTDNSLNILKEYEKKYSNIKVFSQKNSGLSLTRNKGIEESQGKYIHFLDSDDYLLLNALENMVYLMETYNLDLVRFGAKPFMDNTDYEINKNKYNIGDFFNDGKIYGKTEFLSLNRNAFNSSACLYIMRRQLLINNNLRFKQDILHEDELFTLQVFLNTGRMMYDSHRYYRRRYREDSIMTSQNTEKLKKSFESYCVVINEMNGLLNIYKKPAEIQLIKSRMRSLYIGLVYKKVDEGFKRKKLSQIRGISIKDRFYYSFKYKVKKYLKKFILLGT